jgi:Tfp pilus assembly PilM family ATPase
MMQQLQQLIEKQIEVPVVGVDLGSSTLKVVEIQRTKDQIKLKNATAVSIGTHNPAKLLRQILEEYGVQTKEVVLGLSSPELVVRPFQFPMMSRKELQGAIMIEAEQAVLNGASLSKMTVDWYTYDEGPAAAGEKMISGIMAVVPQKVMDKHLHVIGEAGLIPRILDVKSLALWNAYWTLTGHHESVGKSVLLVHLGFNTTQLILARGMKQLILVRDLEMGANHIRDGAEPEWTLEIMNSIAYAKSRGDLKTLDQVFVTGGGLNSQIPSFLQPFFSVPVMIWNPFDHILWDKDAFKINTSDGPKFAIAIGLALRKP